MMLRIIFILFISFYLEANISLFINYSTNYFNILFVLSSIIIISELIKDKSKFYFLSSIIGFFYDLMFTSKLGFNLITFLLTAIFIKNIDKYVKLKIIKYLYILIFYRIISYSILILTGYLSFDWIILSKSIYSSIILNYLYIILLNYTLCKNK